MKKQTNKQEEQKHVYSLELTEKQAKLLSWALDSFSRIICGQDWTYQEMMESAWEKRAKEATGNSMDKEFEGGWNLAREDAEIFSKQIKKRFWGLDACSMYGVNYDDTSDILFDLHTVLRHELWLNNSNRRDYTVDAYEPTFAYGSEPLAKITSKIINDE